MKHRQDAGATRVFMVRRGDPRHERWYMRGREGRNVAERLQEESCLYERSVHGGGEGLEVDVLL